LITTLSGGVNYSREQMPQSSRVFQGRAIFLRPIGTQESTPILDNDQSEGACAANTENSSRQHLSRHEPHITDRKK
jgi:hypothetical protein